MKYVYKRKIFISILFFLLILLVFRTFTLTYNDFPKFISEDSTPRLQLNDNGFKDSLIILPRTQYKSNYSVNSYTGSTFGMLKTWEFVFVLQLALQIIVIDRRKQIITLIIRHYEGSKYKDPFSFL